MRKGFGLITAIIFIVIIAILGTYALLITSQGIKESSDTYLKTQADILNKNALEYATLRARQQTDASACLDRSYVYIKRKSGGSDTEIVFKDTEDNSECLFKTLIKYTYYNSNICGKYIADKHLPNHKMVIKAEAVTTTCEFLDGWGSTSRGNSHTNKISTYGYVIIGK